jgi:DNA polymerase-3 subunit delta
VPGFNEINRDITDNTLKKLYVFFGDEVYLRINCLSRIQKTLIPEGAEGFNYQRIPGKGLTLNQLSDTVESIPFLCERRLVIADDFDLMGIPSPDRDRWASFLGNIPETCCLIFVYDALRFKPDGRSKIQAALNQHAQLIEFKEQEDHHLIRWIEKHFKAAGFEISRPSCEHLIFRCGRGMSSLAGEIQKIIAYSEERQITRQAIDEVTEPALEAVVFDLSDAIAGGNPRKAAEELQTLQWMREAPEVMLGAVGKTLRGLYAARLAGEHKKTIQDLMKACGLRSSYHAEKLMRLSRKRPLDWYADALLAVREADAMLKGEIECDRERVMEWLLAKIV